MLELKRILEKLKSLSANRLTKVALKALPDEWIVNTIFKVVPINDVTKSVLNHLQAYATEQGITLTELVTTQDFRDLVDDMIELTQINYANVIAEAYDLKDGLQFKNN